MQTMILEAAFIVFIAACFVMLGVMLPVLVVMGWFMPSRFVQRYWKPPHFPAALIACLDAPLLAPARAAALLAPIAFSHIARHRKMPLNCLFLPPWYRIAARLVCGVWVLTALTMLLSLAGMTLWLYVSGGEIAWSTWAALMVGGGCFVMAAWLERRRRSGQRAR